MNAGGERQNFKILNQPNFNIINNKRKKNNKDVYGTKTNGGRLFRANVRCFLSPKTLLDPRRWTTLVRSVPRRRWVGPVMNGTETKHSRLLPFRGRGRGLRKFSPFAVLIPSVLPRAVQGVRSTLAPADCLAHPVLQTFLTRKAL